MKDRLVVVRLPDGLSGYQLTWWIADEGDYGALVGQWNSPITPELLSEDVEFYTAELVAGQDPSAVRDVDGFSWRTKKDAVACKKLILSRTRAARAAKPWPLWAVTAHAAGWMPPKGWMP